MIQKAGGKEAEGEVKQKGWRGRIRLKRWAGSIPGSSEGKAGESEF